MRQVKARLVARAKQQAGKEMNRKGVGGMFIDYLYSSRQMAHECIATNRSK
jgi:hypothetical protein